MDTSTMQRRTTPRGTPVRVLIIVLAMMMAPLTAAIPAQAADTGVTVDFETGPPLETAVNDEYLATSFVQFIESDPGFRPYRRSAPGKARSGTVVADVGYDVCYPETHDGSQCEFVSPSMTARLSRSASSVTVYAGLFSAPSWTVSARLTANLSNGTQVIGSAVPISGSGFTTPVTVSSPAGNITSFVLSVINGTNASLGFDDLTMTFSTGSLPDIGISVPKSVTSLRQATSRDIPVTITRINGSNGPVDMKVSGLPSGVSGYFLVDPVTGTGSSTTLRLTAADSAPEFQQPVDVTVTGDPLGNAGVAQQPRSETTPVTVASNFDISVAGGVTSVDVPDCAPADVTIRVQRHAGFTGTVTLQALTPAGVVAEFLPSADVPAGSGLVQERTLSLRKTQRLQYGQSLTLLAGAPGFPGRVLQLGLGNAAPAASLAQTVGWAPRRGQPGTRITVNGSGFCPGTRVQVGNRAAEVTADVAADRRSLTFRVPRGATSGPVRVLSPDGWLTPTTDELTVRTFRNQEGFAFANYPYEWLSFGELTDLVGIRDMFIEVNPCWPWYDCSVPTGVPDPLSYITWGALNVALRINGGGHCFGITRTVQELLGGKVAYSRFASGVSVPWNLPSESGPNAPLESWLDSRQAGQGTAEFLWHYTWRDRTLGVQLGRVRTELAAGRYPGIALRHGFWDGHAVTAYDVEDQADGSVKVYVYDSNRPFTTNENSSVDQHLQRELVGSVITVAPGLGSWSFPLDDDTMWTGDGSDWFTVALSAIPDDPSLPSVNALMTAVIFGAGSGTAEIEDIPATADYLPTTDGTGEGTAGFIVTKGSGRLTHTVRGVGAGHYTDAVLGDGFAGAVNEVATGPGVLDHLSGDPQAGQLVFSGQRDRVLEMQLALDRNGAHRSATLRTRTFKGGTEEAGLGKALTYRHIGPATAMTFELTSAGSQGVAHFVSGRVRVVDADSVRVTAPHWKTLDKVRVVVRHKRGGTVRKTMVNRHRPAGVHIRKVRVMTARDTGSATVRFRVAHPATPSTAGVVVRVYRNGTLLRKRGAAVTDPGRSGRAVLRLGRLPAGRYRFVSDVSYSVGGEDARTVRDRARTTLRITGHK